MRSILEKDRWEGVALDRVEAGRYARHLGMPEVGIDGQRRLKAARVLLIGAGGLGSPAALYLAAAGVGTLGLVDFDAVDLSNLQRQILHGTADIGKRKVASAARRIGESNPATRIETHDVRFDSSNAMEIAGAYDLVIDGSDNFPARYLANDVCVFLRKPNVHGSILRFEGQCSVFAPHLGGPCYRCLYPQVPPPGSVPGCSEAGVLGVLPGLIGVMQAVEAVKLIVGIGEPLLGRVVHVDALAMRFREFRVRRDPTCPVCSTDPAITAPVDESFHCASAVDGGEVPEMSVEELKARIESGTPPVLIDVREPFEWEIARIPGARLVPLGELPSRLDEFDPADELVIQCKVGGRSARAAEFLRESGFPKVHNLAGGILAWADRIDPSMPSY